MKQSISELKKELFESFFEAHLAAENRSYFNEENKEVVNKWFNSGFWSRNEPSSVFFEHYPLLLSAKKFDFEFVRYCWENGWYATKSERIDEIPNPLGFVLQFYGEVKKMQAADIKAERETAFESFFAVHATKQNHGYFNAVFKDHIKRWFFSGYSCAYFHSDPSWVFQECLPELLHPKNRKSAWLKAFAEYCWMKGWDLHCGGKNEISMGKWSLVMETEKKENKCKHIGR